MTKQSETAAVEALIASARAAAKVELLDRYGGYTDLGVERRALHYNAALTVALLRDREQGKSYAEIEQSARKVEADYLAKLPKQRTLRELACDAWAWLRRKRS